MSWRTVVISKRCKLDYRMGYMVVRAEETKRIFIDEVAVLMIENPAVSFTGCLLEALTEKKVKVIFCDSKHNPMAEIIPYHIAYDSSQKIRRQISWDEDIKDLVWTEIVAEKIRKQADFLSEKEKQKEATMLYSYIGQMEHGDVTNREGHAAKVYFNALFGPDFIRSENCFINSALNYGYSIILSAFNREIVSKGYMTQLGLFHDNMYNPFNLACDLMEPFRILVDREVMKLSPQKFDKEEKYALCDILNHIVMIDGNQQTVINAVKIYTGSVFEAINQEDILKLKFYNLL
ncbi:MAG: type II CRISPR-associated endonuclease Cas1 [Ruminiclostridium sp.]|nr:type II CRISPR-associated endonuclease Cas1 [Ruminiclostridium sp.]